MSECNKYKKFLVEFADGELNARERSEVEAHLESCEDCKGLLAALERSLAGSELIWEENYKSAEAGRRGNFVLKAVSVAAGILIVVGLTIMFMQSDEAVEESLIVKDEYEFVDFETEMARIEAKIETAYRAEKLFAAASLLEDSENLKDVAMRQFEYIAENYGGTETAIKAREKLSKL